MDILILISLKLDYLSLIRLFATSRCLSRLRNNPLLWKFRFGTGTGIGDGMVNYRSLYLILHKDQIGREVKSGLTDDLEWKCLEIEEKIKDLRRESERLQLINSEYSTRIYSIRAGITSRLSSWIRSIEDEHLRSIFDPGYFEVSIGIEEMKLLRGSNIRDISNLDYLFKLIKHPVRYKVGTLIGIRSKSQTYNPDLLVFIGPSSEVLSPMLIISIATHYDNPPKARSHNLWLLYEISRRLNWKNYDLRKMYRVGIDFRKYRCVG